MTSLWYLSGNTFEFIKAISDTVFDMINAVYRDKPLIFIWLYVWVNQDCFWHCIWHDQCRLPRQAFDFYLAIRLSLSRLFMYCIWHDKFRLSWQAFDIYLAIRLSLSRLFMYCIWHDKFRLSWQAFDIYHGYTFEFIKAVYVLYLTW